MQVKRLLVTGGAGFIGSNFIRHILKKYDNYFITNLDKLTYCGNIENLRDIEKSIAGAVNDFKKQPKGARIILKKVDDPDRFGVAELKGKSLVSIEEKPKKPKSDYAVTGIYMYDNRVFDIIKSLKPSRRGELEITDVNNAYLAKHELEYSMLDGWWTDSGTFDSLLRANNLVAETENVKCKT